MARWAAGKISHQCQTTVNGKFSINPDCILGASGWRINKDAYLFVLLAKLD